MKYANFLNKNGTIGFVAPAFGCSTQPYQMAFVAAGEKFKSKGYRLDLGPNCFESKGVGISNTPQACGDEFMEYYCKKDNDCLISCGGGELLCEVLDYIDFEMIQNSKAKWFMGYSDNTNLTHLLATLSDTASIYGPCAATFGMEPWHEALEDAMDLLTGRSLTVTGYPFWEKESLKSEENPLLPYNVTEPRVIKCFPDKDVGFTGRLMGGCMDCLVNLVGTRYDRMPEFIERYKHDGIIWFLEACDLNTFSIRRAMWQMDHAGWFEHVKGFLIGRFGPSAEEVMGLDAYHAILETAGKKNVPVIMDLDLGHLPPMMPLIAGSLGYVTVCGGEISIRMELKG